MDKPKKVEAWRFECPFCKEDRSVASMCNACGNKREVISVEISAGKLQLIKVG